MFNPFPAELREPVWYILAGFILGFAVSTLWEWLYFRRFRVESTIEEMGSFGSGSSDISTTTATSVWQKSPEFEPASTSTSYRSPNVFLNRERMQPTAQSIGTKSERTTESDDLQQPLAAEQKSAAATTEIVQRRPQTEITAGSAEEERAIAKPTQDSFVADDIDIEFPETTDAEYEAEPDHSTQRDSGEPREEVTMPPESTFITEISRPEGRVPRSRGYPDDLTKIRGIGEVYKRRLFASHIFTFHHVATSDVEVLRRATKAAPNANVDSWPAQAEELAQKYQRTNASYSGPLPDDLQQIDGIGPYFAQTLYRNGICTFEQLADASVDELSSIFPPSVIGREIDLQQWVDTARQEMRKRQ